MRNGKVADSTELITAASRSWWKLYRRYLKACQPLSHIAPCEPSGCSRIKAFFFQVSTLVCFSQLSLSDYCWYGTYRRIKGDRRVEGSWAREAGMWEVSGRDTLDPPPYTCSTALRRNPDLWRHRDEANAYQVMWHMKVTEDWAKRGRVKMPVWILECWGRKSQWNMRNNEGSGLDVTTVWTSDMDYIHKEGAWSSAGCHQANISPCGHFILPNFVSLVKAIRITPIINSFFFDKGRNISFDYNIIKTLLNTYVSLQNCEETGHPYDISTRQQIPLHIIQSDSSVLQCDDASAMIGPRGLLLPASSPSMLFYYAIQLIPMTYIIRFGIKHLKKQKKMRNGFWQHYINNLEHVL